MSDFGIERLRRMVNLFNNCNESFNTRFTIEELVKLGDAYQRSEWDIPPDEWTERQIRDAIDKGRAPTWMQEDEPSYDLTEGEIALLVSAHATIRDDEAAEDAKRCAYHIYNSMGIPVPRS